MESHDVASLWGLTDHACHVILHILDPRTLSEMEPHHVASIICQALTDGHVLRYTIRSSIGIGTIRFTGNDNNISSFKPQFVFTPDGKGLADIGRHVTDPRHARRPGRKPGASSYTQKRLSLNPQRAF